MGFEKVGIIDPAKPDSLNALVAGAFDGTCLVQEHGESVLFEMNSFYKVVMVAENGEAKGMEMGNQALHGSQ